MSRWGFGFFHPKPLFSPVVFVVLVSGGGGCAREVKACGHLDVAKELGRDLCKYPDANNKRFIAASQAG